MNTENNYLDRAKSRLHNGTTNEVARAQAEATLALAYEQHTANLIAYLNAASTIDLSWHASESVLRSVQARVEERLGLA